MCIKREECGSKVGGGGGRRGALGMFGAQQGEPQVGAARRAVSRPLAPGDSREAFLQCFWFAYFSLLSLSLGHCCLLLFFRKSNWWFGLQHPLTISMWAGSTHLPSPLYLHAGKVVLAHSLPGHHPAASSCAALPPTLWSNPPTFKCTDGWTS